jgi:hypothetical protein
MELIDIKSIEQIREPNKFGIVNPMKASRMLNRIVLDITYECSLKCLNCNRLCGIFNRKNETGLEKIKEFVDTSIRLKKKWAHIYIAGGEPSLHSRIYDIFGELDRYIKFYKKEFNNNLIVKYFTNNHSKKSNEILKKLPDFIINNSDKKDSNSSFKPICVAPIDLGFYDDNNLLPCSELYNCGMTLNYKGYYPCAEAAAIDDVFLKKDLAIPKFEDINFERMAAILHQTCRYCGYYFEPVGYRRSSGLMISKTWKNFLEKKGNQLSH